jgi:tetratricopeptide (TPR) repeat protein
MADLRVGVIGCGGHAQGAIDLAPDYADAYYNRGVVKGKLGEYKAAIEDYDKAIDLKPDYAMAYNNRGMARSALRQHEAAIEDYNITLR